MTTMEAVCEPTAAREYAVLRRGDLDARDRAILCAVWRAWVEYRRPPSIRELQCLTGLASVSTISWRVNGHSGCGAPRRGGGLIERGWLSYDRDGTERTLRPGPRFVALQSGWPLETNQ